MTAQHISGTTATLPGARRGFGRGIPAALIQAGHEPDQADSDPRPAAVTFVTTEHFTLQGARSSTISESTGRASVFLQAVSGGLVALGLVATAARTGVAFYMFGLILPGRRDHRGTVRLGRRAARRRRFRPLAGSRADRRRGRRRRGADRADALSECGLDPGHHGIAVPRRNSRATLNPPRAAPAANWAC